MRRKLLLDTDIGSDIDDAVCLAYVLAQPDCELLGITTVTGEPERRAMLASALCRVAGKEVPIYPGSELPLLVTQRQPAAPQASALSRWEHQTIFPKRQAIEFLRRIIHENPGEVDLLTIGPLTNIALLFKLDPEVPSLLRSLVSMCGYFGSRSGDGPGPEWNASLDPHATAIVYRSQARVHRSVGLDMTRQVTLTREQVDAEFQTPLLQPVYEFAQVWFEKKSLMTLHDPLAATTLFDDGICEFERGTVEIELTADRSPGTTYWSPGGQPAWHEVAVSVHRDRFFEHLFGILHRATSPERKR